MPASCPGQTDALLALVLAGGALAPRRRLLARAGSPAAALAAGPAAWRQAGLDPLQCRQLDRPDPAPRARCLDWLAGGPRRQLLAVGQPGYPPLLAMAPEPPLALFVDGDPDLLLAPAVAVVGSRHASLPGCQLAARLAGQFGQQGLCVASGLAAGIDAAAHRACLASGLPTLAVIGTGPDRAYPSAHRALQAELARSGALVSEYPPGTAPRPGQFPARNRILAGLALAVVVVEAALRSGALITARLASEAGREVFAVPGSPLHGLSRGCNRLLREGAGLCEDAGDVLPSLPPLARALGLALQLAPATAAPAAGPGRSAAALAGEPLRVWQALGSTGVDVDELVRHTGLTVAGLSAILLDLELAGMAVQSHGRWQRSPAPAPPTASPDAGRG